MGRHILRITHKQAAVVAVEDRVIADFRALTRIQQDLHLIPKTNLGLAASAILAVSVFIRVVTTQVAAAAEMHVVGTVAEDVIRSEP